MSRSDSLLRRLRGMSMRIGHCSHYTRLLTGSSRHKQSGVDHYPTWPFLEHRHHHDIEKKDTLLCYWIHTITIQETHSYCLSDMVLAIHSTHSNSLNDCHLQDDNQAQLIPLRPSFLDQWSSRHYHRHTFQCLPSLFWAGTVNAANAYHHLGDPYLCSQTQHKEGSMPGRFPTQNHSESYLWVKQPHTQCRW